MFADQMGSSDTLDPESGLSTVVNCMSGQLHSKSPRIVTSPGCEKRLQGECALIGVHGIIDRSGQPLSHMRHMRHSALEEMCSSGNLDETGSG